MEYSNYGFLLLGVLLELGAGAHAYSSLSERRFEGAFRWPGAGGTVTCTTAVDALPESCLHSTVML